MRRATSRVAVTLGVLCLTAGVALAQTTTSSSETKAFEVHSVDGNVLVVSLPEGTREITVPADFRFTVNGQPLSASQLKPGMKGTAVITTRTTVTPVTVTQVKSGTVMQNAGSSIIVRTDEGIKMFTQSDADKRGVRIMRDGQPAQISDLRQGDQLTAVIITSKPPRVMTEKEVTATLAKAPAAAATAGRAATAPSTSTQPSQTMAQGQGQAPSTGAARTLPKTASARPILGLLSVLLLAMGCALTIRRLAH
jgi:hypothetical protein